MSDEVLVVTTAQRVKALPETPGLRREQALQIRELWAGVACTTPRCRSEWHHHGNRNTAVYVIEGTVRLEYGSEGRKAVEARQGDFLFIPAGLVHREINPADGEHRLIVFRHGGGPLTTNVDGPVASIEAPRAGSSA